MQRRRFLQAATTTSLSVAALTELSACARTSAALAKTRPDAEGPFYPVVPIPLDNNLLVNNSVVGEPLLFSGHVLDTSSKALSDVRVEIWQCDGNSVYRHPKAPTPTASDSAFKGYGATLTDQSGGYAFNTIVPVPYPGRPPHIHVKLIRSEQTLLTTQIYLHGFRGPDERKLTAEKTVDGYEAYFELVV
jgi:protocatechuate 3,4-dioxygenase beta subunit